MPSIQISWQDIESSGQQSFSVTPVIRPAMEMHDSQDVDPVPRFGANDSVRKCRRLAPPDAAGQDRPSTGVGKDPIDGSMDLDGKLGAQLLPAQLVVVEGLEELRLG